MMPATKALPSCMSGASRACPREGGVIRLHKKKYGVMQIVDLTNLSWPAVRTAIDLYEAGGMAALKPKERGKKSGDGRSLTPEQEAHIRKLIADQRPEQLKFKIAVSANISSVGVSHRKSRSRRPTSSLPRR